MITWETKEDCIEGCGPEESGAIIKFNYFDEMFSLYEIPQYGGNPVFSGKYSSIEEAKKITESWT